MSEEKKNMDASVDTGMEQDQNKTGLNDSEGAASESVEQGADKLQHELLETKDQLLRLAAEFDNFKRRMERERETLMKYAGENILRELLPTIDNMERALEQGTADSDDDPQQKLDALLEGVGLTRKGLLATLEKFDVVPIESVGREFDPNEHEAMSMEASDEIPPNHVLQEFVKGYRFKDRLLRPAKVVVSQK